MWLVSRTNEQGKVIQNHQELWDKFINLNEDRKDFRIAKHILLVNQTQNFIMRDGESMS